MIVENYSVYTDRPYPSNFRKLYKGVIVVVDPDYRGINPYMHFAIRKKKAKETIFKTRTEKMYKLIFKDTEKSITCEFDRLEKNTCPGTLVFDEDTYNELKVHIPSFMSKLAKSDKEFSINNNNETKEIVIC